LVKERINEHSAAIRAAPRLSLSLSLLSALKGRGTRAVVHKHSYARRCVRASINKNGAADASRLLTLRVTRLLGSSRKRREFS
jgi:hypothetical protein